MNPLKIIIPEGTEAEIDHLNRVVVFNPIKKEETLPLSVKEIQGRDYMIHTSGEIGFCPTQGSINFLSYESRAEAFLALMQLVELRDAWNGEWRADWLLVRGQHKWCICFEDESPEIFEVTQFRYILHFKSKLLAERFLKQFKGLIEQAKELL